MKISKRTAIGLLLVVTAYVFVPSMGANSSVNQTVPSTDEGTSVTKTKSDK